MFFMTAIGKRAILMTIILSCFLVITYAHAESDIALSTGETLYVSIYSNIYVGPKVRPFHLEAMLSIRNTDTKYPIIISHADYYDTNGKLLQRYIKEPIELKPLASIDYYIKESDTRGGSGANFIVKWRSKNKVNKPIIEGIMTSVRSGYGISFRCPGQPIIEHVD